MSILRASDYGIKLPEGWSLRAIHSNCDGAVILCQSTTGKWAIWKRPNGASPTELLCGKFHWEKTVATKQFEHKVQKMDQKQE